MSKYGIVMPVANEEDGITNTINELLALPYDFTWYPVMDHYSKDNTESIIRAAQEEHPERIHLIFYKEAKGVATCYLYGFQQALKDKCEYIIEMDAGGSHLISEMPQFINALEQGYKCVWGSRFVKGGGMEHHPLYRRLLSGGGTVLSNLVLGTKLKDMTSGYEAFHHSVLDKMNLDKFLSRGHMYQTEMRYYCRKQKAKEVPIHYIGSSSSLKLKSVTDALKILFQLKKNEALVMKKH